MTHGGLSKRGPKDVWATVTDDDQPTGRAFAPGWASAIGICASVAMLVSPFLVWERVNVRDLPRGFDVYSSLQWSAIHDSRGVVTAVVGAVNVLVWILTWGLGSDRYGYWLVAASGVLSTIVLGLAVSVAADPGSAGKLGGGSGIPYRVGPGLVIAVGTAAVLTVMSLLLVLKRRGGTAHP